LPKELLKDLEGLPSKINNISEYKEFTTLNNVNYFDKLLEEFYKSDAKFQLDIFRFLSNRTLEQAFKILKYLKYF